MTESQNMHTPFLKLSSSSMDLKMRDDFLLIVPIKTFPFLFDSSLVLHSSGASDSSKSKDTLLRQATACLCLFPLVLVKVGAAIAWWCPLVLQKVPSEGS